MALAQLPRGSALTLHFQMSHAHLFAPGEDGPNFLA